MSHEAAPRTDVRTLETDEVLRCIGRNVVTFQQIEQLLKALATMASVAGPASELSTRFEQQAAAVHRKMMGELAGQIRTVADERTPGGGTRTIYRINARYELQRRQDAIAADNSVS